MSVFVITGVSKGIGFELLKQISSDSKNVVVGLVRDKPMTEKRVAAELSERSNVHILHADLVNYVSLKQAAADTTKILGGRGVDFLVANGAYLPLSDGTENLGQLASKPEELDHIASISWQTNVVGNIHLFNLFLPLVLKSKTKKVITISSGHADLDLINEFEVDTSALYAASKAAMNVIVGKFNAQYKKDGVLFLSISPGAVDVGHFNDVTPEQMEVLMKIFGKFTAYAPGWKGPTPVNEAVPLIRSTWERASIEDGFGGAFVSQFGNKQWL